MGFSQAVNTGMGSHPSPRGSSLTRNNQAWDRVDFQQLFQQGSKTREEKDHFATGSRDARGAGLIID